MLTNEILLTRWKWVSVRLQPISIKQLLQKLLYYFVRVSVETSTKLMEYFVAGLSLSPCHLLLHAHLSSAHCWTTWAKAEGELDKL